MSSNAEFIELADPVCGKPVGWPSAHRHVHGGALFCFCSEACRARFAAHPSRQAFIALSGGLRSVKAQAERDAQWRDTGAQGFAPSAAMPLDDSQPAVADSGLDGRPQTNAGASFGVWRTWRERRMATRCCRKLLSLYETLVADNPHLSGNRLYEGVVAAHNCCDASAARLALKEAAQSYASWPVERDLNFRDVVHYLAVREIFVADSTVPWAQADIKRIIDASIPKDL